MLQPEIMEYYRQGGERDRLSTGAGRLEFVRTWDVLSRSLPVAPARVLDVGGATGTYAGPLADAGYEVHVVDPVPEHVADAAARPGVTAEVGDARALSAADGSVDAVLLLGPLYHLPEADDRLTAWREAARVVRPGGVVVAASISRFASMLDGFVNGHFDDARFRPMVDRAMADGVHRNVTSEGPRLTEILASDELTGLLLEMMRRIEDEPSMLGVGSHLLTVALRSA
ncbi:MAG TPA: class I SAM-dependent methyltransferase [Actinoplanes sp.]|jgi:SAM-dependent methyltransferase